MEREYIEEEGVTLFQIIRVFFGRWKQLLIITASIAIVAFLGITFLYNWNQQTYVSSFKYNITDLNNGAYPDGSRFSYPSLTTNKVLTEVKKTDDSFKNIDLEKLLMNNQIYMDVATGKENGEEVITGYTVVLKRNSLGNNELEQKFVKAIVNYPLTHTLELAKKVDHKTNLQSYDESITLGNKLNYLNAQISYIDSTYSGLISKFGDSTYNGTKLSEIKRKYDMKIEESLFSTYSYELTTSQYVYKYDTYLETLKAQKAANEKQLKENQLTIDNLNYAIQTIVSYGKSDTASYNLDAYNNQLASLIVANSNLTNAINDIDLAIKNHTPATNTDYDTYKANETKYIAKLDAMRDLLTTEADNLKTIYDTMYEENAEVVYVDKAMQVKGGLSTLITVAISVGGGLLIAGIVNLVMDREKLTPGYFKKKEEKVTKALDNNPKAE